MKLLLAACNAKYIHSNLAVYNLRAYAEQYQDNILLREYTINQQKDDIMRDIYKSGADVVCFSCYIWNISFVKELLQDHNIYGSNAFLLTGSDRFFLEPRTFQYYFKKVLVENGIPDVNYHMLRHTFATRCIEMGFDMKSLSEILGYSTVNITLNNYIHTSMKMKRDNMQRIAEPLFYSPSDK